jgi:glyoxylase-like metal-dependent hydrolase (beta-lactamase superfamily II)
MQTNSSENQTIISPHNNSGTSLGESRQPKPPRQILDGLFSFHPNRETLGGTSYLIVENTGNILVDCPAWDSYNQQFLHQKGVRWLFLTHRGGIGKQALHIQTTLGCEVVIQEQEAYLLPEVKVTPFEREFFLSPTCYGLWTPGHTPGSSCLYWNHHGGVLFTGRHLLPNPEGILTPLRTAKTFHWLRQLRSVELLRDRFSSETLTYVCPGANIGFLRGRGISLWAELNLKT